MPYNILANSSTPALIIYLLDVSASMGQAMGEKRRIDVVMEALRIAMRTMVFRSTKGKVISPRYRLAMYAYSDKVFDLLDGIKPINEVAALGVPDLSLMRSTDTALGFQAVERLLQAELPRINTWPAPIICHLTDGEFTGNDPEPIVRRIMNMSVADGPILVENIFISDQILPKPVTDPHSWPGIDTQAKLSSDYARKLRSISSPLPESFRMMMLESNYHITSQAVMMLPGDSPDLVSMGFQMSMATPIR